MGYLDRLGSIFMGLVFVCIGYYTSTDAAPMVSIYAGLKAPVPRWLGWPCIFFGVAFIVNGILGFIADRKKHLIALARCKAEREREAAEASREDKPLS